MSISDYTKPVSNPTPFNPDFISTVDTLNVFVSAIGKTVLLFHAPEANHIVLGGNNPAAYNKLSTANIVADLMSGNIRLAQIEPPKVPVE
jgi:hypothetical protein